ncbi:MAG TPA: hypothetical protein VEU31_11150 [Candidatus Acidoferrales bacterium]|nr:hypothetical protein [Candidatus Acidoferrales bacterium]
MENTPPVDFERARSATLEEISLLVHAPDVEVLQGLIENPLFNETHLCLLLERKDLSGDLLEAIARRRELVKTYRVKKALAFHPHVPRIVFIRVVRELYLMDLVQLTLLPATQAGLKRLAEDVLISRLAHLPLGQKLTLARRAPARVAGALLAEGHAQIAKVVLDNPFLTEAQVLKALSYKKFPAGVVQTVATHRKWSLSYNVRLALLRHPATPLAVVLAVLPNLTVGDLKVLSSSEVLPGNLRRYVAHEIEKRMSAARASRKKLP